MIRPCDFGPNGETCDDNDFQQAQATDNADEAARSEFDALAEALTIAGVQVEAFEPPASGLPDAVFPNNWLSTHPEGRIVLYPMRAPIRRKERHQAIVAYLKRHYVVEELLDLSGFENKSLFLEGTGSLVFDHAARRVFAALSARTHPALVKLVARLLDYEYFLFHTRHPHTGKPLYHTNVILSIAPDLAIWIPDVVADEAERQALREALYREGRSVLELPPEALASFAANALLLHGKGGLVLAASVAARSFLALRLPQSVQGVFVPVPTIERLGGGSVRCMLCENFLKPRPH